MPDFTRREMLQKRLGALKTERESFDGHYQSLAEFISPRRSRLLRGERNKGGRHHWNKIINGQATWALRVATAGIFNGIMSPSRPWLMLETDDAGLNEFGPAKEWFFDVQERMRRVFNASNLYNMAPMMIREQLMFGTGAMSHEDDLNNLARFYTHTAGSYWISQNDRFIVDTVFRETERTVAQIVGQFSRGGNINPNISTMVKDQYDKGNYHQWYPIVQAVEPNPQFILGSLRQRNRRFISTYYEPGNNNKNAILSERGFDEFPFYVPRWEVTNEDIYGTDCPGMTALGDVRQLQHQEKRKGQGVDKMVAPPLHGPAVLKNQRVSHLPSGANFYDAPGANNTLKAIYDVRLPISELVDDMDRVSDRINRAFYVDLFLAISAMEGVQPRNQLELTQRNQERLLQLGPTLERQFGEFLDPMVSRTFNQMVKNDLIPPPPPDLQNRPLQPRYVSSLAMAQQSISTGTIDRVATFTAGLVSSGWADAADKFDPDQAVDEYATLVGAPPRVIRDDEQVAQIRQQRAQQEQQLLAMQAGEQMAGAAATVGNIDLGDGETVAGRISDNAAEGT